MATGALLFVTFLQVPAAELAHSLRNGLDLPAPLAVAAMFARLRALVSVNAARCRKGFGRRLSPKGGHSRGAVPAARSLLEQVCLQWQWWVPD